MVGRARTRHDGDVADLEDQVTWLEEVAQDVRIAGRGLAKHRDDLQ